MYTLEPAQMPELDRCNAIIEDGKAFQKAQGFTQWTEDYPNRDMLRQDILTGKGFVLRDGPRILGYMCIDFDGEPAYANIEGAWNTPELYAVVHRMAFSRDAQGLGLSSAVFPLIEELCRQRGVPAIRIDTDFPNLRMQHILEKNGFSRCGTIVFQGSGKLAFDKQL